MPDERIQPTLHFFINTPERMADLPPLASSLQSLESCFISIRFNRYPDALINCVTAWENTIKAALKIPADQLISLEDLIRTAREMNSNLRIVDPKLLGECRQARNRIVHYGYSPRDDEECARQLLRTGIPFLEKLYIAFFDFYLLWQSLSPKPSSREDCNQELLSKVGIFWQIGDYLDLTRTYFRNTVVHNKGIDPCLAFLPFAHCLTRRFWNPISEAEEDALERGADILFDAREKAERRWLREVVKGDCYQRFDCPICHEPYCFFAIFRDDALDREEFGFRYGCCLNCEFFVPEDAVGMVDLLLKPQLTGKPNPA